MWVPAWILVVLAILFCVVAGIAVYALISRWRVDGQLESERAAIARDRATFWGVGS